MERDEIAMTPKTQLPGSSKVVVKDVVYSLYFRGVVRYEIGGLGVAICDQKDQLLFQIKDTVSDVPGIDHKRAEIMALIRGLSESLDMGVTNLVFYVQDLTIYHNITGIYESTEKEVIQLIEQVKGLREKFASCEASLVLAKDVKFASELAYEATASLASNEDEDEDDDWNPGNGCDCGYDCESPPVPDYVDYYSL